MTAAPLITLANLLPIPVQQFFDDDGAPLAGGRVYTYTSDGVTPKATYQDSAQTILHTNPIDLDASGRPTGGAGIYGLGNFVFAIFDENGVQIGSPQPTADTTASLDASSLGKQLIQQTTTADMQQVMGVVLTAVPYGSMIPYAGTSAPTGWALCHGQPINRADNPNLFTAIGTTWGDGDGMSTFNVPDARGNVFAGADAMGGAAANRLTTVSMGTDAVPGVLGGHQITQQHNHNLTYNDPGHDHPEKNFNSSGGVGGPNNQITGGGGGSIIASACSTAAADTNITVTEDDYGTGDSQNVQPTMVGLWIIQLG